MKKKCGAGLNFIFRNYWVAKIGIGNQNEVNASSVICNVHDIVFVFGLGGIDLLHCCGRASTETCCCQ